MKIRRISCSMGRTLNMGNFESLRVETEFAAQIEETEDIEDCWEQLVDYARSKLKLATIVATKAFEEDHGEDD